MQLTHILSRDKALSRHCRPTLRLAVQRYDCDARRLRGPIRLCSNSTQNSEEVGRSFCKPKQAPTG